MVPTHFTVEFKELAEGCWGPLCPDWCCISEVLKWAVESDGLKLALASFMHTEALPAMMAEQTNWVMWHPGLYQAPWVLEYCSFDLVGLKDNQIGQILQLLKTTAYFPYNSSGSHTIKTKYSTGINCWLGIFSHSELTCTYWRPPWLVSTPAAQTPPYHSDRQCRPEIDITRSVI